jgi:predicted alpha/beta hydrolase family esterase
MMAMRTSDCEIIIVPGHGPSDRDHWQSRWEQRLSSARRVAAPDAAAPDRELRTARLVEAVAAAKRPVVLVAHGLGVLTVAHAAPLLAPGRVRGAFLAAPPDLDDEAVLKSVPEDVRAFGPVPRDPLPFPSVLVGSRSDPRCSAARAEDIAYDWGAAFVDAGDAGGLDVASGHGPWPEGLMRFAGFLSKLQPA